MYRLETGVVRKYFEPLDLFLKVRIFTAEEICRLLQASTITNKKSYMDLVINACIVNYNDEVLPRIREKGQLSVAIDEALYQLAIDVNPGLDIRKITIPAQESEKSELHLLDRGSPLPLGTEKLAHLEAELKRRIVGQDSAIESVVRAIKKAVVGLRDPQKPIATFFFVGQTGVGKTELAKALTLYLYGSPSKMIRIDCSEYALPHEYAKLLGSPPGYVGFDEGGVLADRVAHAGDSFVVLFDEIEKSDHRVHDLLLQVMDEGLVTDNKGRPLEFRNAIIVLTSNVGAEEIERARNRIGFDIGRRQTLDRKTLLYETLSALKTRFRPEFINRITEIVLFQPVGLAECEKIVMIFLEEVRRHAQAIPLMIDFAPRVPRFIAERGYKPEFGARELKRTVEREVESPLSELLLEERIRRGDRVFIDIRRDELVFKKN